MTEPRFILKTKLEKSEFTRAEPSNYLQVIVEDEPASALSLTVGSIAPEKYFIFETKPTSRSGEQ